ncbi:hypothetical protein AAHC03_0550 [Spirometra sp. Aus1]
MSYIQNAPTVKSAQQRNLQIVVSSIFGHFSPLLDPQEKPLIENTFVKELAEKHRRTPGQILLRHVLQEGLHALVQSSCFLRLQAYVEVSDFQLSEEEMNLLRKAFGMELLRENGS